MTDAVKNIIETLGLAGIAMTAVAYLAKQIVLNVFSRDLTAHKASLDRESQRHLHELTCLRQQFHIQYSKTYERQVDAIRQLYDGMRHLLDRLEFVRFHIAMGEQFGGNVSEKAGEAIGKATQAHTNLKRLCDDNDIYLPEPLSQKIGIFLETLSETVDSGTLRPGRCSDQVVREWSDLWAKVSPQTKELQAELKTEFRRLQGVDTCEEIGK